MRLLILIAFSLCASCAYNPDSEAHRLALWNFNYEADILDERRVYSRIDKPFYGDCEDFAFTLRGVIGGDVWYVILPNTTAHAVLVKDGITYDNIQTRPTPKSTYNGVFTHIMRY